MKLIEKIFLVIFLLVNINNEESYCIQGIYDILEHKNMVYNKTKNSKLSVNLNDNYFYEGTLFFWLKIINYNKDINNYNFLSIYDDTNTISISFNLVLKESTMNINGNPNVITHRNVTWAYYGMDFENKIVNNSNSTIFTVSKIYEYSNKQTNTPMVLPYSLNLSKLNFSIGNFKDQIFDEFNGEVYDFKLYYGLIKNIDGKYNTAFKEPKLTYFINFLKHASNSQIFKDSSGNNFPNSINGISEKSVDFHDLNSISNSDLLNSKSNEFVMNQPYQFIKLPNEILKGNYKEFYQKSIYFNIKINSHEQYAKVLTTSQSVDLYLYSRLNKNNDSLISILFQTNSFAINSTSNNKESIDSKIILKENNENRCYLDLNITDKSLYWKELNIKYLILVIINNPFKEDNTFIKLYYENFNSCIANLKRNLSDSDNHYIGNKKFEVSSTNTNLNIPTIYSIRFIEFGFFEGGDFNDPNSCYKIKKISGKLFNSFAINCHNINILNRDKNFYNCEAKLAECEQTVSNCEICRSNTECIYCKNGYKLVSNQCNLLGNTELIDTITKNIVSGSEITLSKIDKLNLQTTSDINFLENKIKAFRITLPNTLKLINLKNKNYFIGDNYEFSYFSESTTFSMDFSILKSAAETKRINIKTIHDNSSPPSATYEFEFDGINNAKFLQADVTLDCNQINKPISFPCHLCSNKIFKIIKDNIFSECVDKCPTNNYIKNFICFPCDPDCIKCSGPTKSDLCVCKKGFKLIKNKCIKCDNNCQTCEFSSDNCTSCKEGYYLEKHLNLYGICKKCHEKCELCYNSKEIHCLKCKNNLVLYNNNCVKSCPSSYFLDENNICKRCPTNCLNCKNEKKCLRCISSNYFLVEINGNILCRQCSPKCKNCINKENNGKKCKIKCEENFYQNLKNSLECVHCDKCQYCFSNEKYHCKACFKCKNQCNLEKIKIDDNTFQFRSVDFTFKNNLIKNHIKIFNITEEFNYEIPYNIFAHSNQNQFIIKLLSRNYEKVNITINEKFNILSKDCILKDEYIINEIEKINNNFFFIWGLSFKSINILIYFLSIIFCIFWESLASKFIDIFKLSQFFKYLLLINLSLGEPIQEFLIISNPNNLINFNFFDDNTRKHIETYLVNYINYKPLLLININTIIVKGYIILFFLILSKIFKYLNNFINRRSNKIHLANKKKDSKENDEAKNKKTINPIKENKNKLKSISKLNLINLYLRKISFTMLRLDSVNIFFLSIAFFNVYINIEQSSNKYLFINSIIFLFINTFGYIHLYNTVEWIKMKLEGIFIDQVKDNLTKLMIMMSKKKKGLHLYLSIIEEIKYNFLILILFLFKKFVLTQLILIIMFFLTFYIIISFSLVQKSIKYLLYFLSETILLTMLFPLMFSVFFKIDIYFSFLIILFIFLIYTFRLCIAFYYIINKIRKKYKMAKVNPQNKIKKLDILDINKKNKKTIAISSKKLDKNIVFDNSVKKKINN